MADYFANALDQLAASPILQGMVAALATFILEDPTTITCGALVAEGHMLFTTALVGLTLGIAAGDFGLYAIGRLVGPSTVAWGLLSQERLDRVKRWFDRNLILAVVLSRFMPGTRLPTYVGAGIFQASPIRFLGAAIAASLLWTLALLAVTVKLGQTILPMLGAYRWPVVVIIVALLVFAQRRASKHLSADDAPAQPVVSFFEFWPPYIFYFPVGLYYAWLALRFRGTTLPTAANPSIYSGGLIRESKSQILSLVPESQRMWIQPFCMFTRPSADIPIETVLREALDVMRSAGIDFPIVAKPDKGQRGAGVQRLRTEDDLRAYLESFPPNLEIVFQQLADLPCEAGVMYYRYPGSNRAAILSITLKEFPTVVGDGAHTLRELILADPRARIVRRVYFNRHGAQLDRVLPPGERFPLVFAGNHAQGTVFKDGTHLATPALLARLHGVASSMPGFYFGRFDIRFTELDAFLNGDDVHIVEINGAGAESTHIWDATMTLRGAYGALFRQWRILFEIGAANRRCGVKPLNPFRLLGDCIWYRESSRRYPLAH
ncbi:MAG: VTT domain-containing protein [Candidatus Hydrogenedentes bacterium]|nr:VTT domain-containing protein [Candidatus Hydrogenedentota bacterium]